MNFEQARWNMVEQQVRTWDVIDDTVLGRMLAVKREEFVPQAYRTLAFAETEIPLGHGATMLLPVMEGKILQVLQIKKTDTVLEVGTGSGYFAALLGALSKVVLSVEIVPELAREAREALARNGVGNVRVEEGDGIQGWAPYAPYDVIVVSGVVPTVPDALLTQLKPGGRLFAFTGDDLPLRGTLIRRSSDGNACETSYLFETDHVKPMVLSDYTEPFVF